MKSLIKSIAYIFFKNIAVIFLVALLFVVAINSILIITK